MPTFLQKHLITVILLPLIALFVGFLFLQLNDDKVVKEVDVVKLNMEVLKRVQKTNSKFDNLSRADLNIMLDTITTSADVPNRLDTDTCNTQGLTDFEDSYEYGVRNGLFKEQSPARNSQERMQ